MDRTGSATEIVRSVSYKSIKAAVLELYVHPVLSSVLLLT